MSPRERTGKQSASARLPWWALALPALAFAALLALVAGPVRAAEPAAAGPLTQVADGFHGLLPRLLSYLQ